MSSSNSDSDRNPLKRSRELSNSEQEIERDVCSLQDVIEHENNLKQVSKAVLAASDSTNCSYNNGYIYRQALYSCITCMKNNNDQKLSDNDSEMNGICLACSYECHMNHEMIELYTKRNFRCDCGNSKFNRNGNSFRCQLQPSKDELNSLNKYNHNFIGLYCTCNRPYPENGDNSTTIDDTFEPVRSPSKNNENDNMDENDEMLQCSICEDWFHSHHLLGMENLVISENTDDDELICHLCMYNNQFLWYYQSHISLKNKNDLNQSNNDENVNIIDDECTLEKLKLKQLEFNDVIEKRQCSIFLKGWRENLCRCQNCMNMYREKHVLFLLQPNDTIEFYEECGERNSNDEVIDENKLLNDELNKLDRIAQIEFLTNMNEFKQELMDFLADFAKNAKVVRREDIVGFFQILNERKRKRINDSKISAYFCK